MLLCLKENQEKEFLFVSCARCFGIIPRVYLKGNKVSEPFVGNGMWVIGLSDPDGYRLEFESYTDVAEETRYSDWKDSQALQI